MKPPLIVDAHEDLAWNILAFGRDYTRSVSETRRIETENNSPAITHQGHTLLGSPEYRQGRVAVVFGTLFVTPFKRRKEWETLVYADGTQARREYRRQADVYHEITDRHPDRFRLIGTRPDLQGLLALWQQDEQAPPPTGIVPLMEGAEGITRLDELESWWQAGVRIIGPAWAGTRFCGGSGEPGPLTEDGRALLKAMAPIGFILDISHMDELAARQALDLYAGTVIASHANAAAVIPAYEGNRQLSDPVLRALIERGGVVGLIPFCRFLDHNWKKGDPRQNVPLAALLNHVDHICQMSGDARAVGLGSDYDGGFGVEAVPAEVESIADLQKIGPLLAEKGYPPQDVSALLGGNWLRILEENLPQ